MTSTIPYQRLYQKKESHFRAISTVHCQERMPFFFRVGPFAVVALVSQFNSYGSVRLHRNFERHLCMTSMIDAKEQKSFKLKKMTMRVWLPEVFLVFFLPHLFASKHD